MDSWMEHVLYSGLMRLSKTDWSSIFLSLTFIFLKKIKAVYSDAKAVVVAGILLAIICKHICALNEFGWYQSRLNSQNKVSRGCFFLQHIDSKQFSFLLKTKNGKWDLWTMCHREAQNNSRLVRQRQSVTSCAIQPKHLLGRIWPSYCRNHCTAVPLSLQNSAACIKSRGAPRKAHCKEI